MIKTELGADIYCAKQGEERVEKIRFVTLGVNPFRITPTL